MNKPIIYIEPDLFWEDQYSNAREVISKYFSITDISLVDLVKLSKDDRTVRSYCMKNTNWRACLNIAQFIGEKFTYANASKWLPYFRNYCINGKQTYFQDFDFFQTHNFEQTPLFLRPVEPFKIFSGQVFDSNYRFNNEYNFLKRNKNIDPCDVMCMVSPVAKIDKEYRCIFINNEYISGSQYMENEELKVLSFVPNSVIDYAQEIAEDDYFINIPDFVIDVGFVDGNMYLVEINGFETSSFYGADLDKIYKTLANNR